jgi:hypothetical protein
VDCEPLLAQFHPKPIPPSPRDKRESFHRASSGVESDFVITIRVKLPLDFALDQTIQRNLKFSISTPLIRDFSREIAHRFRL